MLRNFSYLLLFLVINSHAENICFNNSLFQNQKLLQEIDSYEIEADHSQIKDQNIFDLNGNVNILGSEFSIDASKATIDKNSNTISAHGNVQYSDLDLQLLSHKVQVFDINSSEKRFSTTESKYFYPDTKIRGNADTISGNKIITELGNATYTLCPIGNSDWLINADKIKINKISNRGEAEQVVLSFYGIPLIYTPSHSWVLKGKGSGFLAPRFGRYADSSSSDDFNFYTEIPYYFNIAPDKDFLLTHKLLSSRGNIISGAYRQLTYPSKFYDNGKLEIEFDYLDSDEILSERRWKLNSSFQVDINPETELKFKYDRVSDQNYLKEIALQGIGQESILSFLSINHENTENKLAYSIYTEESQQVNNHSASYTRSPEISISKGFELVNDANLNLSLNSTKFKIDDKTIVNGNRTHLEATIGKSIDTLDFSFSPNLTIYQTDYSLNKQADTSRSLYKLNIDSSLNFERELRLMDKNILQTLVPRLAYSFVPKKNQSQIPSFDSADRSNSYTSMFDGRKYTGLDRISNLNEFTLGVESEFIDDDNGDTFLTLNAAQTFRLEDQTIDGDGNFVKQKNKSDILTSLEFRHNSIKLSNKLELDSGNSSTVNKNNTEFTYLFSPKKFINVGYLDDNGDESTFLNTAIPLNNKIHFFLGTNKSLSLNKINKITAGIGYESCCWAFRLGHFKKLLGGNDWDHTTSFEIVLKGLSSTSPNFAKTLEKEIPNYLVDFNEM